MLIQLEHSSAMKKPKGQVKCIQSIVGDNHHKITTLVLGNKCQDERDDKYIGLTQSNLIK